jgi:hypothetical protein
MLLFILKYKEFLDGGDNIYWNDKTIFNFGKKK